MKFAVVLLAAVLAVGANGAAIFSEEELNNHFEQFKFDFSRTYSSPAEEQLRKNIFAENLAFIHGHNREFYLGLKTFSVAINNFTDLTNFEFRRMYNGYRAGSKLQTAPAVHQEVDDASLPATVDWTTKGVVTPIKNQQQCGSCWSFSTTGSIEGQHAIKTGKLVSLSEQNLMDCSKPYGPQSCEGGWMDDAFKYVIHNHGIDTEASYPYLAEDEPKCLYKKSNRGATISSFVDVKHGSEAGLKSAIATVGPVSVAIDASNMSFQFYSSGVYNEPACQNDVDDLDHGVLAVGYGTLKGQAYYKVKNSWGTSWGQQGYILMSRNRNNQCGISTRASYPVV